MIESGTTVRIVSDDPTRYLRMGDSATPPTDARGFVYKIEEHYSRRICFVDWGEHGIGAYFENALVRVAGK